MSVRMMSLVWELDLPDSEKLVLLALADCANDEGRCWPSVATLVKKCSKSERTVQGSIRSLCAKGHLTQKSGSHKSCDYIVHPIVRFADPRSGCTPAESAPRSERTTPPQPLPDTPAAVAPKPSKKPKEPSKSRRAIPDDWQPRQFGEGTQSRAVVDGWPAGELEAQLEQFKACHRSKGNTFIDPQDAWSTWVLNTRKFGIGRPAAAKQYVSASGYVYRGKTPEEVQREAQRRNDNDTYWQVEVDRKRAAQSVGDVVRGLGIRAA